MADPGKVEPRDALAHRFCRDYAEVFGRTEQRIGDATGMAEDELRKFTQVLLARLLFLRFVECKGWLEFRGSRQYLRTLYAAGGEGNASFYRGRLRPLFFEGLATEGRRPSEVYGCVPCLGGGLFDETDLDRKVPDVPDEVFFELLSGDRDRGLLFRYEFTLEEPVGRDSDAAMDPEILGRMFEQSVAGRRETGSYYTPRPVVCFMCRETLKGYLEEKTEVPAKTIAALVDRHEASGLDEGHARQIVGALDDLKMIDPACGSGAFLIGFLHELAAIYRLLYGERLIQDARTPYDLKLRIIEQNLYGVELDPLAAEIAKQRLWLSLMVEADRPGPLSSVAFKIKTGDSLLAPGPRLVSGRGFDIALGNPPYVSAVEFTRRYPKQYRKDLRARFASARGAYDIYVLFFERGLEWLRPGGLLGFITPNKYLSARYAAALREHVLQSASVTQVVDASGLPIFAQASVYPVLTFLRKAPRLQRPIVVRRPIVRDQPGFDVAQFTREEVPDSLLTLLPENIWGFLLSQSVPLLRKLIAGAVPLGQLGEVVATTTAVEADQYGRRLTDRPSDASFRVVNTGTIDPFAPLWGRRPMRHRGRTYDRPFLPAECASPRRRAMYGSPKVVFAKIARRCEAFLDAEGVYASLNTNCFYAPAAGVSLEYICGFCNSQVFMFLYEQFFGGLRMNGGYFQFQAPQLRVVPIRVISEAEQQPFIRSVRRITAIAAHPGSSTAAREEAIGDLDRRFFDIYGLDASDRSAL